MAKRFSIVTIDDEHEVFLRGYVDVSDLHKSKKVVSIMSEKSSYVKYPFRIEHCLLMDFPDGEEDISVEELNILLDVFDDLVEDDYIYVEEMLEFELYGLSEVEEFVQG